MNDPKVLAKFGCTKDRLRRLFTAEMQGVESPAEVTMAAETPDKKPKNDGERRRAWEALQLLHPLVLQIVPQILFQGRLPHLNPVQQYLHFLPAAFQREINVEPRIERPHHLRPQALLLRLRWQWSRFLRRQFLLQLAQTSVFSFLLLH